MSIRIGDVWQSSDGSCYKVLYCHEPFLNLEHLVAVRQYKKGRIHRLSISIDNFKELKLIYRAPIKCPMTRKDREFYKDVHDQIKCL